MTHLTFGYLTIAADPVGTIHAAAEAGFRSAGIRITGRRKADDHPQVIGNPAMIREIRAALAETGMRLSSVSAYHFYPDLTADDLAGLADTTAELGAEIAVANDYIADDALFLDLLAPYAERAGNSGIRVAIEFMKYSQARSLAKALQLAEDTGLPNVGLLLDPLHLDRAGTPLSEVAALPPERLVFAQICDAAKRHDNPSMEDLAAEARSSRRYLGQGEFDLAGFMDALPPGVEIEYEVPVAATGGLGLADRARLAMADFRGFMDGYAQTRGVTYDW